MTLHQTPPYVPPMPPLAPDTVGGLGVLAALPRNGFAAFPARCLEEPVIRLRMPGRALVLVSAPEAIKGVLHSESAHYGRVPAGRRVLGPIVGRGMLVAEGEAWRRQRRMMAPAFTPRSVPVLAAHIMRCADTFCTELETRKGPIDLAAEMRALALDIAASSMFSIETEGFGVTLRAMVSRYMATIGRPKPSDFLLPAGVPTPLALRRALFARRWRALIDGVIATRRARDADGAPDAPRDLFDLMAQALGPGEEDLLRDEVATMIVAGHETTALTLFWACHLVAHAPRWQEAIADEARGLDLAPEAAAAALPKLAATRAVVQEALRLYPPAFMSARMALGTRDLCGVSVPAGATVLIPFFLLHRDPRFWAAPETFDPRRFLDRPEPERFTYLPFGAGPNICIGAQFAMTEAVLVLARLVRSNTIRLAEPGQRTLPVGVLSTRPDHAPGFLLGRR